MNAPTENRRRRLSNPPRRFWTAREDATMRLLYPNETDSTLQKILYRSRHSIYGRATTLGLNKSPEFMRWQLSELGRNLLASGCAHRFHKGQIPPNKGLRRPGWARGRMRETQFKKGQRYGHAAAHHMPVGATRLLRGYIYIKIADVPGVFHAVNWKLLHVLNWEKANGCPKPKGHCLLFRDGNRMNVAAENLQLITRAENMRRNTVHNLPKDLQQVVQLRGALIRQINKHVSR